MRNEPHWAFVDSLNLTAHMLQSPTRFASKLALIEELKERYGAAEGLNEAWGRPSLRSKICSIRPRSS
ncbi:hypothetical protein H7B90_14855 [Cohnella xylanilytica]|uniref:Uncharacterized protein n=1 Tax=Cohnella xylanilytica TaxID=557555 RepID=A0A841TVY6_9BACL|nr:hypothetical protein [Cohnella xylanilytica]MBB6692687.1 hypothetical protein [Cohnella xylanilytica]